MAHQRAGVAHHLVEGPDHLDVVTGLFERRDHLRGGRLDVSMTADFWRRMARSPNALKAAVHATPMRNFYSPKLLINTETRKFRNTDAKTKSATIPARNMTISGIIIIFKNRDKYSSPLTSFRSLTGRNGFLRGRNFAMKEVLTP
jgi:hypothetical protein